ncbi:MAG: TonB-dependent receptor [Bacteroidetes bacterium]|nr:TonB-dependent receptor [Bacteroidota bacterium]
MRRLLITIFIALGTMSAWAQTGEIQGRVLNEKGQGEGFVTVVLVADEKGTNPTRPVKTNIDGYYTIKPLTPGTYNVMVRHFGYETDIESGIQVNANGRTDVNFKLATSKAKGLKEAVIKVKRFEKPLIAKGDGGEIKNLTAEEIKNTGSRSITDLAASQGGVFQSDNGGGLSIAGSREDGVQYMIDGIKTNRANIPSNSIANLQVLTGGIPAKYGDLSGGLVTITTKDPPSVFSGSVDAITSQYLDPWAYNLVNGSISGPLWKKRDSLPGGGVRQIVKLGYFITGEYQTQGDRNPTANGIYKIKDDVYDSLKAKPFQFSNDGSRIIQTAELLDSSDIERIPAHLNNNEWQARMQGKLDFKISDEFGLTVGGGFDMQKYKGYIQRYSLFNYENYPINFNRSIRGYVRFRHNIGASKMNATTDSKPTSKGTIIENAFYTVQADIEKYFEETYNEKHGSNHFDYGHIGKFDRLRAKNVEYKKNEKVFYGDGANDFVNMEGFFIQSDRDTGVVYTPGTVNPLGASITSQYLDLVKNVDPEKFSKTIQAIEQNGGLVNGTRANQFIHGLYYPFGRQYGGFSVGQDVDQFRARMDLSFDISSQGKGFKNTHSIEFGLEFESRTLRQYSINPLSLWRLAALEANAHTARNVKSYNPTLTINDGATKITLQEYVKRIKANDDTTIFYLTDTIEYLPEYNAKLETRFSKNLRSALGLPANGTDFINVDALDPSQLKLSYFSPDELIDNWGFNGVRYNGYDPYGNRTSGSPSFNDFFKKKDANGEYTREVGAFNPIYLGGYIQDKFQFKKLTFIVGLRVDRFDANQKVLRDKYSVYGVTTVGTLGNQSDNVQNKIKNSIPSNMSQDAVIYVDKAIGPTRITGFREGDFWYDPNGNLIASAASIISASGGVIQPLLAEQDVAKNTMTDSLYDPETSFTDYSPNWNFMPRLQFTFPLVEDKSQFFAHYDVLTQRPTGNGFGGQVDVLFASPFDWYTTFGKNYSSFVNNSNLRAQKTVDFEMGFKQTLSKSSVFTISTFYREYRDQIQFTQIQGAYPKNYFTFGNIDFSTTLGIKVDYEMRTTKTSNLRLKVGYTLSFAEGTGSDARTQFNIVDAGNANLKLVNPLNYDARHNLTISADYRFRDGSGYVGPKALEKVLQNFGVNLTTNIRSGTPYTRQGNPTPSASLTGTGRPFNSESINSSRLPMRFNINMKVDKSFIVKLKQKEGQDKAKHLDFNVYVQIRNLLNAENILGVYNYTGNPSDDGYLVSDIGIAEVNAKEAEVTGRGQSFSDLYKIALEMPNSRTSNFSSPRTIQLGINFNF